MITVYRIWGTVVTNGSWHSISAVQTKGADGQILGLVEQVYLNCELMQTFKYINYMTQDTVLTVSG